MGKTPITPGSSAGPTDVGPWDVALESLGKTKKQFTDFWRTRRAVIDGQLVACMKSDELAAAGLMGGLKFNLAQSSLAAIPALGLKKVLDYYFPVTKSVGIEADVNAVAAWVWPIVFPFLTTTLARMMAWGSLTKGQSTREKKLLAKNHYLYLDGAYGFFPQCLMSISIVLTSAGIEKTPLETFFSQIPHRDTFADPHIGTIYVIGASLFVLGFMWEANTKRWLLSRKMMAFNGYSPRMKWFWMVRDKGRNFGPWNKFLFALSYAATLFTVVFGFLLLGLSWMLGACIYFFQAKDGSP